MISNTKQRYFFSIFLNLQQKYIKWKSKCSNWCCNSDAGRPVTLFWFFDEWKQKCFKWEWNIEGYHTVFGLRTGNLFEHMFWAIIGSVTLSPLKLLLLSELGSMWSCSRDCFLYNMVHSSTKHRRNMHKSRHHQRNSRTLDGIKHVWNSTLVYLYFMTNDGDDGSSMHVYWL